MAKHNDSPAKGKPTYDTQPPKRQDWKRDRYEQRAAKVTARRNITGGF
jgi:hypothetical protein